MRRSFLSWARLCSRSRQGLAASTIQIVFGLLLSIGAIGCADEGVGDPCTPETIPCNAQGQQCGYKASESYIEATSVQCRSRLCIVHKLDNLNNGQAADPRKVCKNDDDDDKDCVDPSAVEKSIYCTCRCRLPSGIKSNLELCSCPSGFECAEILNLGGNGIIGSYCVREGSNDT